MRVQKCYLVVLAILALTMPAWAKTFKESIDLSDSKTIGSTQLKAGSYQFTADDSKMELNILQKGKVIATVQGQWVKTSDKTEGFDMTQDKITQIRFHGSDQAFQLP
jgi:hypothetical protein